MDVLFSAEPIIAVQRFFGPAALPVFEAIDLLGDVTGIMLSFALAFWVAGRRLAFRTLAAVLFGAVIIFSLVFLIGFPRPDDPRIVDYLHVSIPSFPSGHAGTATTLWGAMAAFKLVPAGLVAVIVACVGVGRLYLGVHHVADVLAGPLIGLVALALYVRLLPWLERWFLAQPFRFYVVIGSVSFVGAAIVLPFVLETPNGWQGVGVTLGGAVAMPVEYRLLRYSPRPLSLRRQALKLAVGLSVIGICLVLIDLVAQAGLTWLGALGFGLTMALASLGLPALFVRLGLAQSSPHLLRTDT